MDCVVSNIMVCLRQGSFGLISWLQCTVAAGGSPLSVVFSHHRFALPGRAFNRARFIYVIDDI
jgi:hypothetical protein